MYLTAWEEDEWPLCPSLAVLIYSNPEYDHCEISTPMNIQEVGWDIWIQRVFLGGLHFQRMKMGLESSGWENETEGVCLTSQWFQNGGQRKIAASLLLSGFFQRDGEQLPSLFSRWRNERRSWERALTTRPLQSFLGARKLRWPHVTHTYLQFTLLSDCRYDRDAEVAGCWKRWRTRPDAYDTSLSP